MLHKYFEHIYYINLNRRVDRNEQMIAELSKHGIKKHIQRISAVDKNDLPNLDYPCDKGNIACAMSHLKIAKDARGNGYENYLVLEDDAEFDPNFTTLFQERIKELPADWDLFYLGANHNAGVEYKTEHICKCIASYTTHAFAANYTIYDAMIAQWENQTAEIDVCLARLHKFYNCYSFIPNLVTQRAGFSDILNKDCDYDFLKNNRQTVNYKK